MLLVLLSYANANANYWTALMLADRMWFQCCIHMVWGLTKTD